MLNLTYNILRNIKNRIRQYFFLHKYRKDTPESTQKFYSRMRYVYKKEFKKGKITAKN